MGIYLVKWDRDDDAYIHEPKYNSAPDYYAYIEADSPEEAIEIAKSNYNISSRRMWYPDLNSFKAEEKQLEELTKKINSIEFYYTKDIHKIPFIPSNLYVMLNAIKAAQNKHTFIYRNFETETTGNPYAHAIMRGYVNHHGESHPNYHYEDLMLLASMYDEEHFLFPSVIVDANHSNSGKKYLEQIRISKEIIHSMSQSEIIRKLVKGIMIESYIEDGAQKTDGDVYGKSITDPCLGWEKTEVLIKDLAMQLSKLKK